MACVQAAQRPGIDLAGRQAENVRARLRRLEDRGCLRRTAHPPTDDHDLRPAAPTRPSTTNPAHTSLPDQPFQVGTISLDGRLPDQGMPGGKSGAYGESRTFVWLIPEMSPSVGHVPRPLHVTCHLSPVGCRPGNARSGDRRFGDT